MNVILILGAMVIDIIMLTMIDLIMMIEENMTRNTTMMVITIIMDKRIIDTMMIYTMTMIATP